MEITIKPTDSIVIEIDDIDQHLLNKYKWFVVPSGNKIYLATADLGGTTYLHRLIMNATAEEMVDHKDGNSQNYKRDNLRLCNKYQNAANKKASPDKKDTTYKGVYLCITPGGKPKWKARINHNGEHANLCRLPFTPEGEKLAALIYDEAARRIWGEFAHLNFPDESYLDYINTFEESQSKIIPQIQSTTSERVSQYRGVHLCKSNHKRSPPKWEARINHKGKRIIIARFPYTPEGELLAAKAYDKKAKELQGDSAKLNF